MIKRPWVAAGSKNKLLKLIKDYDCNPRNLICCIGPCIRKECFLVNDDVANIYKNEFQEYCENYNVVEETDLFNEISIEEYNEKVAGKKDFILYIHSPTCSHCLDFKPKLNKIIKKKHLTVFGMDMSKEENRADNLVKDGTPVLIIFKGGEEVNRQIGDKTEKETLEFLKDEIK